ncbi:lysophospholipase family protein [Cyberlindnera jadinii NRRL Y-1542]|uniref:Lysophospholipase n=1 Tax=Cyberlindnera jadinii (strain ATCC 18201 / CBS 1600 / BCRC 20928 / JCM 3617 / NBRC 0987 / NRRL Y-1542) TaxID=983966 RepID=A0A1E4S033_CYBJN|nr:phospholipase B [Cyberlindnera jadinii NRRL Y-1542]ODV72859.1 phospholipase B [Cyberlindnera jadinii NRRL Y-1542]
MLPFACLAVLAQLIDVSYSSYAPVNVSCPQDATLVRSASSISDDEKSWLEKRHSVTDDALSEFLERADLDGFDAKDFLNSLNRSITIGLAFSGGGYRAMLNGAGQVAALDSRTEGANEHGLGGLLQASTYFVGLSGGNWLTGTLALNNWTSVEEILSNDTIWDLENSIVTPGGSDVFETALRWQSIKADVDEKAEAGFDTSLTDLWGRALAYQFFGEENDAEASLTYSSIVDIEAFQNGEMPFPISIALGRAPDTKIINLNSTVFEFNPFELGSWDPSLYSFANLKYIGSNVTNGEPTSDICVEGFDNAGFVLGTSSSLFNTVSLNVTGFAGLSSSLISTFLGGLDGANDDVAVYSPNPFFQAGYASLKTIVESEELYLVDGGEDGQNIPFAPMLQQERDVDVIFAFDNSDNTEDNFPDGTALVATYNRQFSVQGNGTGFPYVPTNDTFLHNKLGEKPMFLGCNSSNLTDLGTIPPLIVYIPNIAYTAWSNTSTLKMSYSTEDRNAIIQNGFEATTRFNLTIDENWPKCVACAIIHREQERNGWGQSDECAECFEEYCWNGEQYTGDDTIVDRSFNYTSSSNLDKSDMSSGVFEITVESSSTVGGSSTTSASDAISTASSTSSGVSSASSSGTTTSASSKNNAMMTTPSMNFGALVMAMGFLL